MGTLEAELARYDRLSYIAFRDAWVNAGGTRADMEGLIEDKPAMSRFIAHRQGRIVPAAAAEVIVDCDAPLAVVNDLELLPEEEQIQSRFRGKFRLNQHAIALYLAEGQCNGGFLIGMDLALALEGQLVLPDPVLDALLLYPELIPETCKGKDLFFWGTKRRGADRCLHVRYLRCQGRSWGWSSYWLGSDWGSSRPSAVSTS